MVTRKMQADAGADPSADMFGLSDLGKLLEQFHLPGIDVTALVEAQRKDMQALADANREAYEGIRALVERRHEILRESLAEWRETMKESIGPQALAKQAEVASKSVQQAIADFRELAEMEAATRNKTWMVLQDRFQGSTVNLQKLLQPQVRRQP